MDVPLVVFVNTRSGGLQGAKLIEKFKKCMPTGDVFDLSQGGPAPGLQKYSGSRFRIVVCGGDGSVGWVLTEIDKLKFPREITPPVAILPIGTGNDLSRVLKWGGSHNGKGLKSVISRIEKACVVHLDKWKVAYEGDLPLPHTHHFMHNYFSVGADASIALQFHELRLAHPERFTNRTQNLAWYVRLGLQNLSPEVLTQHVSVEVNGQKVELPEQTRCVVVLNLPSYSGGGNPWGTHRKRKSRFQSPAVDDGLLEVVAVNGPLQLVGIHANIVKGKRLGQGNNIKITLNKPIPAQVDGEPWKQPSSVVSIQHSGKSLMLANSQPTAISSAHSSPTPQPASSTPRGDDASNAGASSIPSTNPTRVLIRTRSSSTPIEHTPSPIQYGPIQTSKRKKGRVYCDGCGLEFYLPYMLSNHMKSGLCGTASGASESRAAAEASQRISVQLDDGTENISQDDSNNVWRSRSAGSAEVSSHLDAKYEVEEDDEGAEGASEGWSEKDKSKAASSPAPPAVQIPELTLTPVQEPAQEPTEPAPASGEPAALKEPAVQESHNEIQHELPKEPQAQQEQEPHHLHNEIHHESSTTLNYPPKEHEPEPTKEPHKELESQNTPTQEAIHEHPEEQADEEEEDDSSSSSSESDQTSPEERNGVRVEIEL